MSELTRKKNEASEIMFAMVDSATPANLKSGLTVTDDPYYKDGTGAWTALTIADAATEIGSTGMYTIEMTAAELNHDLILIKLSATGAADTIVVIRMTTHDIDDVNIVVPDAAGVAPTAAEIRIEMDTNSTKMAPSQNLDDYKATGFNTVVPDAAGTAATPAEVATALSNIYLDHLLAVDYDPANKPGTATALLNELVEDDGGVSRYTANALEQAPSGGTNPNVLMDTTISSVTDQTHFVLNAGSDVDDAYKDQSIVVYDASDSDFPSVRKCSGYAGSSKTVTIDSAPDFTIVAGDGVKAFVAAPGTTAPTAGQNADAVCDELLSGHTIAGSLAKAISDTLADTDELEANQGNWLTADVSNLDVAVSTRNATTPPTVVEIRQEMDANSTKMAPSQNLADYKADVSALALEASLNDIKGSTFDGITDSLESIRDRGDAAWITGAGGSDRLLMVDTTIATLASQTSFTLTDGSADDNAYVNCTIVIEDASTSTQKAVGLISAYAGSTKTVTLKYDPAIFTMAVNDKVYILAENSLKTTVANRQLNVAADGDIGGNVDGSVATLVGHTPQTGDNYARLGAPAGASVSADILTIDNFVDDLESRLTDVRAGYLDNLSAGAVALASVCTEARLAELDAANLPTDVANIEADTQDLQTQIGTAGAGLSDLGGMSTSMMGEVQTKVNDALTGLNLDHLMKDPVDTSFANTVHLDSALGYMVGVGGSATFDRTTDSQEAIRNRGDDAWTTGGAGSISEILNVQALIPNSIDLANTATVRIALGLTNMVDDLPSTAEITPGTITIDRKAIGATSWTTVVNAAACSELAGLVYYDEVFDAATGYAAGDSIRITFKSQKITVDTNDFEITGADGWMFQTHIREAMRGTDLAALAATWTDEKAAFLDHSIATTQADLDTITGSDGVVLATQQLNYAPNTVIPDAMGTAAGLHATTDGKIDAVQTDATAIKAKTDALPSGIAKNVALSGFNTFMVLSSDHVSAAIGKTVTGTISKDGGTFNALTNSVTEIGSGMYKVDLTQSEMDADVVTLKFVAADCDARIITIYTS